MIDNRLPKYYVGAHIGVYDPDPDHGVLRENETTPPEVFDKVAFDAVDVLHIGHLITTKDGQLEIGIVDRRDPQRFHPPSGIGSVVKRFEHVVMQARYMNPNILILLEHMYSGGEGFDNLEKPTQAATDAMIDKFTDSVVKFLLAWHQKAPVTYKGKQVSMRIDGFDIDHEGSTMRACTKDVIRQLHDKFDNTAKDTKNGPRFILGMSPAFTDARAHLDNSMADYCDFINLQRYSGGYGQTMDGWIKAFGGERAGLVPDKFTYGIEIETPANNCEENKTIEQIKAMTSLKIKDKALRGIWTWRLGATDWEFQNLMQVWLYNLVHFPHDDQAALRKKVGDRVPDIKWVKDEWRKHGGFHED